MGLIARIRQRRAERLAQVAADRAADYDDAIADARADAVRVDYAVGIGAGIYRDQAGGYCYSSAYLVRLADRCRHIDRRTVASLLRIAAQEAMTADGVPPLVTTLTEADVDHRPALRLVGPEVA